MNRLLLFFSLFIWLSSSQAGPSESNQADSQAIREIQRLDQSQLDFDFLEDNSTGHSDSNNQASEAALLEALELLDQSPDEYTEENILAPLEASNDLLDENHQLSTDMDEEIEASLDQDFNDEIEGVLEDLFDEQ